MPEISGSKGTGVDLAEVRIPLETIDQLGIDTTPLRDQGLTELSLEALGVNTTTLESQLNEVGITTTTVSLDSLGTKRRAEWYGEQHSEQYAGDHIDRDVGAGYPGRA